MKASTGWNQLSVTQRNVLLEVHMFEFCLESAVYFVRNYGNYKTYEALLKRGLLRLQDRQLFVTEQGAAIIPPERITYPIYKQEAKS